MDSCLSCSGNFESLRIDEKVALFEWDSSELCGILLMDEFLDLKFDLFLILFLLLLLKILTDLKLPVLVSFGIGF